MKKIKFLFYLIVIGVGIFALDDKHIVKDIDIISYESANEGQQEQPNIIDENVKQEIPDETQGKIESEIAPADNKINLDTTQNVKNESSVINKKNEVKNETKVSEEKPVNKTTNSVETSMSQIENSEVDYVEKIKKNNDKLGTVGRLYIPSVNLNVGVNHAQAFGGETYTAQEVVDKKDSAAYYRAVGKYTIADHNYQGFDKINNVKVGDKAYIKNVDGTITTLVARARFLGKNLSYDLVDNNGSSVYDMSGDIIMYTCYKNSKSTIMITLWDIEKN